MSITPNIYFTGTGQRLYVHSVDGCCGNCVIHNPSNHPLCNAPTHWRNDRNMMERICEHGIGHPDPDGLEYLVIEKGLNMDAVAIHGCCGCCREDR